MTFSFIVSAFCGGMCDRNKSKWSVRVCYEHQLNHRWLNLKNTFQFLYTLLLAGVKFWQTGICQISFKTQRHTFLIQFGDFNVYTGYAAYPVFLQEKRHDMAGKCLNAPSEQITSAGVWQTEIMSLMQRWPVVLIASNDRKWDNSLWPVLLLKHCEHFRHLRLNLPIPLPQGYKGC